MIPFFFIYLLLIQYCRFHFYQDPTSVFFDPNRGREQRYSKIRTDEGLKLIHSVTENNYSIPIGPNQHKNATYCVGILTVGRHGPRYFKAGFGTLLEGLDSVERSDIYLMPFIAQTDPHAHPAYGEKWLAELSDEVLTYSNISKEEMERVEEWERDGSPFIAKGVYDYIYLLEACQRTGAQYIVILEDDIVALDGWYHRMREALGVAKEKTRKMSRESCMCFLSLFSAFKPF
jgi:hypothetical protein